ncbi:hypothetical protein [Longimicrobium sp.]|uniref:hypothetical protein n=1 Tax=Longimicrobium sp. TaxID=2029185 RepID=UPI002C5D9CD2|nr:hypothetical protein [Longimicrobium sp.]HSU13270.1 hypothetical protein [Longimicrobium sp.]
MIAPEFITANQFALELAKQEITLATAFIGITISFTKDLLKRVHPVAALLLAASWIAFCVSISAGTKHIGALARGLEAAGAQASTASAAGTLKLYADSLAKGVVDTTARWHEILARVGLEISPVAHEHGMKQDAYFLYGVVLAILYGIFAALLPKPGSPPAAAATAGDGTGSEVSGGGVH